MPKNRINSADTPSHASTHVVVPDAMVIQILPPTSRVTDTRRKQKDKRNEARKRHLSTNQGQRGHQYSHLPLLTRPLRLLLCFRWLLPVVAAPQHFDRHLGRRNNIDWCVCRNRNILGVHSFAAGKKHCAARALSQRRRSQIEVQSHAEDIQ